MSFGKKGLTDHEYIAVPNGDSAVPQREARVHRLMKVTIFHERFGSADGVLRDVSSGGLGGRCSARLVAGDRIEVDRPGLGRFEAQVRWARNGQFGAQLTSDQRIDTKQLENQSLNSGNWDSQVNKPLENHVFTRFKPMQSTYRPTISMPRRDK